MDPPSPLPSGGNGSAPPASNQEGEVNNTDSRTSRGLEDRPSPRTLGTSNTGLPEYKDQCRPRGGKPNNEETNTNTIPFATSVHLISAGETSDALVVAALPKYSVTSDGEQQHRAAHNAPAPTAPVPPVMPDGTDNNIDRNEPLFPPLASSNTVQPIATTMPGTSTKYLIWTGALVLLVVVLAAALIAVLVGQNESENESNAPNSIPSTTPLSPLPSSAPTSIEIPRTGAALARYSGEAALRDPTSPQGKALAWIVNEDSFVVNEGLTFRDEKYIQRYIIAVFYYAMDGDNWETCYKGDEKCKTETAVSKSWLSEDDECSWKYLDCDQEKVVDTMDYLIGDTPMFYSSSPAVTLRGEVPQEFRFLTHLTRIAIPGMKLTGPLLSYVSNMTKLATLSVPDNNFTGTFSPSFVADHMDLTRLDLSRNQFSGKIPIDFENLEFLTEILLEGNQFIGPIPRGLGLSNVELLDLQNNLFSGELPLSIYNARLKKLYVAGNPDLEGTIPSQIGNMTSLVELKMGRTALGGELPAELFATPLQILQLNDASFYGPLPETYFEGLTDTLVSLWLFNNNFEGTIPIQAIWATTGLEELVLDGNPLLKGTIPASVCQLRGTGVGEINVLRVDCEYIPCAWEGCCDKC